MSRKKVLFLVDPCDPTLSLTHQMSLIKRHLNLTDDFYLRMSEDHSYFYNRLKNKLQIFPSYSYHFSIATKHVENIKNWHFTVEKITVPTHIRKAYYNYPTITHLYWKHMNKKLQQKMDYYDVAVSFSSGINSYYLAEKVHATQKIYYLLVRQFEAGYRLITNEIREKDIVYTASPTMYRELASALSCSVNYFSDPFYKEALERVITLVDYSFLRQNSLSILSANTWNGITHIKSFIQTCKRLVKRYPNFKWFLYGKSDEEIKLRDYIKQHQLTNNIVFLNTKVNMIAMLREIDLYIEWSDFFSLQYESEILGTPTINMTSSCKYHRPLLLEKMQLIDQTAHKIKKSK